MPKGNTPNPQFRRVNNKRTVYYISMCIHILKKRRQFDYQINANPSIHLRANPTGSAGAMVLT